MVYTTVNQVVEFAQLKLKYVYKESLGTGDGTRTRFVTANTPIFDSSGVVTYIGNATADSTITAYQGFVDFTTAVGNGSSASASYTYSDLSSAEIQRLITAAETITSVDANDTSDSSQMELLTNLLTSHLIYKNLAAGDARSGVLNYSIGYLNVSKGSTAQVDIANMYWENYKDKINRTSRTNVVGMTRKQADNDKIDRYYYDIKLVNND